MDELIEAAPSITLVCVAAGEVFKSTLLDGRNKKSRCRVKSALRSLSDCLEYVDNRTPVVVAVVYAKATGSWSIVLWPCWTMFLETHTLRRSIQVQNFSPRSKVPRCVEPCCLGISC